MNGILFRNSFLEQAEWVHLRKRENKRTVPQRAEPFRNAHNCSLTGVYLGTCSGTDYKTATVEIVRSGTVYCSGTVYTVLACTGRAQPRACMCRTGSESALLTRDKKRIGSVRHPLRSAHREWVAQMSGRVSAQARLPWCAGVPAC